MIVATYSIFPSWRVAVRFARSDTELSAVPIGLFGAIARARPGFTAFGG
jgi:hypothetical protein